MYIKFRKEDVVVNTIKTYPESSFNVIDAQVFYNNIPRIDGNYSNLVGHNSGGCVNVHELNIDRNEEDGLIYPFFYKTSELSAFAGISTASFHSDYSYGDAISSTYPVTASLRRTFYDTDEARPRLRALRSTMEYYKKWSPHFAWSGSHGGDRDSIAVNLIEIPRLFFGDSIKKGSVYLNIRTPKTTGVVTLHDERENGELIETSGSQSGSVQGIVFYNEGFVLLTGAVDHTGLYASNGYNKWTEWGTGISDSSQQGTANYKEYSHSLSFSGVNHVETITLFAQADIGELNHSNNPTYIDYDEGTTRFVSGSKHYIEDDHMQIKNIAYSQYDSPTGSFEKTTYISHINVYDENRNVIMVAKLGKPIRKRARDGYTFKIKMDI